MVGPMRQPPPIWHMRLAVLLMPAVLFHHGFPSKIHAFGQNVPKNTDPAGQGDRFENICMNLKMIKIAFSTAAALAAISLSPASAQAYVATVNSVQCDVTTFTGSYLSSTTKIALPSTTQVVPCGGTSSLPHRSRDIAAGSIRTF